MSGKQLIRATSKNPSVHSFSECYLDVIAKKYGTDKSTENNGYVLHYEQHFAALRSSPIRLLELGVHDGRSVRMWADYFPQGQIYGVDISAESKMVEGGRIKVFTGDLSQEDTYQGLSEWFQGEQFDIIIDDASHLGWQQRKSFERLFPCLVSGGFYVIEDLGTSYWPKWGGALGRKYTGIGLVKELVDYVNSSAYRDTEDSRTFGSPEPGDIQTDLEKSIYAVYTYKYVTFIVKSRSEEQ
jgi:demethylmacrocin O-methyltransferase